MAILGAMAGAAAGKALGMLTAGSDDRRQRRQQEELQKIQIKGQKEMTDYNTEAGRKAQMAMWNDTNFGAQVKHLKEAGLNPGLIYGISGGGATTVGAGASAGNVSGGNAADAAATSQAGTAMGMQMLQARQMEANVKLMEAQAEKTSVEAEKIGGADTEQTRATTQLTNTTNELKIIEKHIAENTQQEAIERIIGESRQAIENATVASANADVARKTTDERIQMLKEQVKKTMAEGRNAVKQGNILEAETVIRNFEAEMTKQGIAPGSPWFVKILSNMLGGLGLSITKGVGEINKVNKEVFQ